MGPPSWYPKGTRLFRSGDEVRILYLVVSGVVSLLTNREGRDFLGGLRTPGWLLGAAPAIIGHRHGATAVAMTPCELRLLAVEDFRLLRTSNPAVSAWLQEALSREVVAQFNRAASIVSGDCRDRVQELMVDLFACGAQVRPDGSERLTLDLSVTDLAALVGTGREWVSRLLRVLSDESVLSQEKGWFVTPAGSPWLATIAGRREAVRHGVDRS